jgi:hypothetical protein
MSETYTQLIALIFACIFFGYAMINSLVFYRRARRAGDNRNEAIDKFVRSPRYGQTVWMSGIIGVIGFAIASWRLVILIWKMMHSAG